MNRRSWVLAYACAVETGTWSWFKGSLELSTRASPTGVGQEASSPRSFIRQVRKMKFPRKFARRLFALIPSHRVLHTVCSRYVDRFNGDNETEGALNKVDQLFPFLDLFVIVGESVDDDRVGPEFGRPLVSKKH